MKSYLAILPAALLLLAAAGCASAKPGEPAEPVCAVRAADVQLGDKLLEAYETIEKQFGEMQSFSYLTELKTPLVQNRIWTVRFERKADQGKETVEQDLLFRLVTGEVDGKLQVLGMGFL